MTSQDKCAKAASDLRQKTEALDSEQAARTPEGSEALSPVDILKTLHELQVHKIELEMQNEELRTVQAEIEAGRARYLDLYDMAPVGYCTLSEQGLILETNLTAATLLGTTRSALVKQPISRFIFKDDQDVCYLHRMKLFESGKPEECELRMVKPDGTPFWAKLTSTAAQADDGAPLCRVVLSDITDRKQADEKISELAARFQSVFDQSSAGSVFVGLDKRFIRCNPAFCNFLGYKETELIGKTISEVTFPEDIEIGIPELKQIAEGKLESFATQKRYLRKDGRIAWGEVSISLVRDADSKPLHFLPVIIDITERKRAEDALQLTRFSMDSASEALFWITPDARIVDVNAAACRFLGYTREELLQMSVPDIDSHHSAENSRQRFDKLRKVGSRVFETEQRTKDGRFFPVEIVDNYIKHGNEELSCAFVRDISERKKAEETLMASESLKNKLISNIGDVIVIIDGNGINRYKSPNVTKLFGWKPEELVGENAWNIVHPDDLEAGRKFIAELSAEPNASGTTEVRYKRKDGNFVWISINVTNLLHDKDIRGFLGNYHEITERKQAESELRRLSAAIEQSPETVVITDTAGTIQYVNTAFEKTTGYTCEETIGQNPRLLKSGRQDAGFYTVMWNTLLDGRVWEGRMINKRKDGSLYTEEASIAPVKDPNGTITNYVCVKRDITQELESEEMFRQAQKMESVGRLAGGVAHDFNNLLMGILGYAELCREDLPVGHPVREWVDEITKEAQRSANLTRQLLAFARRQAVAPKVVDLNDVVGNMLKMLRRLIGEDIDLVWQPGAEPWSVKIDPGQVDQILANLCVNARDAIGGAGKITIETDNVLIDADYCTIHVDAEPGSYVMLAVSDDGCGMDQETLANVFEPFFTTKPTGEGSGLGLATVYGIVKQNGGVINVYSEPGKGTTFRIYLPRDTSVRNAPTDSATKAVILGGTETILLVEDETAIRITIRIFLERFGYNVIAAESPAMALRLAAEYRDGIDLLLTDVVMPGMSGRELAGKLAVDRPSMKILYISGYTADVIARRGILEDGMHFLSKPVGRDELAQKVRDVLG